MSLRPRLFDFEKAWAEAAFGAIFPPAGKGALVHGIAEMKPAEFLDAVLAETWLETSLGLRATVWIIALAPLFVLGRFATILALEDDDRETLLGRLLASRVYAVRQLVAGFKAMASLCMSQSSAIRRQMTTPVRAELVESGSLVRVKKATGVEHAA